MALWRYTDLFIIIIIFKPTNTKPQAGKQHYYYYVFTLFIYFYFLYPR